MKKIILILLALVLINHISTSSVYAICDATACKNQGGTCQIDPKNGQLTCVKSAPASIVPGQGVQIGPQFNQNFKGFAPQSFGSFVTNILPQVYTVALLLVLVYVVWGSYRYMISGGDPKGLQAAKGHLTWAVIGMIIIFLSYGMFQLLNSLLFNIYN